MFIYTHSFNHSNLIHNSRSSHNAIISISCLNSQASYAFFFLRLRWKLNHILQHAGLILLVPSSIRLFRLLLLFLVLIQIRHGIIQNGGNVTHHLQPLAALMIAAQHPRIAAIRLDLVDEGDVPLAHREVVAAKEGIVDEQHAAARADRPVLDRPRHRLGAIPRAPIIALERLKELVQQQTFFGKIHVAHLGQDLGALEDLAEAVHVARVGVDDGGLLGDGGEHLVRLVAPLLGNVLFEVAGDEAGAGQQQRSGTPEVNGAEEGRERLFVEFPHAGVLCGGGVSLFRHDMVDAGFKDCAKLGNQTDVGQAFLHDNGGGGAVAVVGEADGEGLAGNGVPAVGLYEGKGAVDFEVEGVVDAEGGDFVFGADGAGDAEGGGDGVKGDGLDLDGDVKVDALCGLGAGAAVAWGADFADGVASDAVSHDDEVVRMPLTSWRENVRDVKRVFLWIWDILPCLLAPRAGV